MSSKAVIESVAKLAERLMEQNRKLRGELDRLGAARERLRAENQRLAAENALLQRRLVVKELAEGFTAGGRGAAAGDAVGAGNAAGSGTSGARGLDRNGTKTARARVNRLLREVDRCIALVNRN